MRFLLTALAALALAPVAAAKPGRTRIVLIGAPKDSHGPGQHEYARGSELLAKLLEQTPGVSTIVAPEGWPAGADALRGASSVVLYLQGGKAHPLTDAEHRAELGRLIKEGCGLVLLHYALVLPVGGMNQELVSWVGGLKEVSYDPHWEAAFAKLPRHPITRGVQPFTLRDEWYYNNFVWVPDRRGVIPILTAVPPDATRVTVEMKRFPGRAEMTAWAFERPGGGRSFGFTGAHTYNNFEDESFRRLVVNAILWTAKANVPSAGAPVRLPPGALALP